MKGLSWNFLLERILEAQKLVFMNRAKNKIKFYLV